MNTKEVAEQAKIRVVSRRMPKTIKNIDYVGRNQPCPCGSGKKFKKCCWAKYAKANP